MAETTESNFGDAAIPDPPLKIFLLSVPMREDGDISLEQARQAILERLPEMTYDAMRMSLVDLPPGYGPYYLQVFRSEAQSLCSICGKPFMYSPVREEVVEVEGVFYHKDCKEGQ